VTTRILQTAVCHVSFEMMLMLMLIAILLVQHAKLSNVVFFTLGLCLWYFDVFDSC
jgi:hypothetical protein